MARSRSRPEYCCCPYRNSHIHDRYGQSPAIDCNGNHRSTCARHLADLVCLHAPGLGFAHTAVPDFCVYLSHPPPLIPTIARSGWTGRARTRPCSPSYTRSALTARTPRTIHLFLVAPQSGSGSGDPARDHTSSRFYAHDPPFRAQACCSDDRCDRWLTCSTPSSDTVYLLSGRSARSSKP